MARIGLFPLELVLVPTERVPLNVFEPRYRELVGECLERQQEFGIVLAKPSGDVHHVGTRAAIVEVLQVLPDGRLHVVVEGGDRFRLLEVDHERSFDTGSVEAGSPGTSCGASLASQVAPEPRTVSAKRCRSAASGR